MLTKLQLDPAKQAKTARRGFTLTETAIVLGVVGVILGAVWAAASIVEENARISAAVEQFEIVSQNMTSLIQAGYKGAGGSNGSITDAMIKAGAIPQQYVDAADNTQADNPWSNADASNPQAAQGFKIYWGANNYRMSFYNVSHKGCVALIMQATNCKAGLAGCPVNVIVAAADNNDYDTLTKPQMTTTQAETECDYNSYSGGANSVEFDIAQ
ncbi:MAG TPA: type II secretion system protein [Alphaproteobacteria bacterium]|nr:type II secretion system protein [Alphaproteobacteria bacterium]